MRFSEATQRARINALAVGAALAVAPALGAQAADCRITAELPDDLAGEAAPGLHAAPHLTPDAEPRPALAHLATHGQVVLGREAPRVLYHLPIFMGDPWRHPHNFQVVLAVAPVDGAAAATASYAEERARHPDDLYTAVPPVFDQIALVYDHPGGEPLRRLAGVALYRGHFERADRRLITEDADLTIERVIHFREFDPTREPAATLGYLLFGRGEERYMAHLLSGPPDFDQILEVIVEGDALSGERLKQGVFVSLDGRSNRVEDRLVAGEAVTCAVADAEGAAAPEVTLRVLADRYCEVGELAHTVGQLAGEGFGRPQACPAG